MQELFRCQHMCRQFFDRVKTATQSGQFLYQPGICRMAFKIPAQLRPFCLLPGQFGLALGLGLAETINLGGKQCLCLHGAFNRAACSRQPYIQGPRLLQEGLGLLRLLFSCEQASASRIIQFLCLLCQHLLFRHLLFTDQKRLPVSFLAAAQGTEIGVSGSQFKRAQGKVKPGLLRGKFLPPGLRLQTAPVKVAQLLFQPLQVLAPGNHAFALQQPPGQSCCRRLLLRQPVVQVLFLFVCQYPHPAQFRLQGLQYLAPSAAQLMHPHGNAAVDFRAGNLLQNRRAFIRRGMQEGRETALGQQHGAGKTVKIHAGRGLNLLRHAARRTGQNCTSEGVADFMPGQLQLACCLPPGPVLAPVAAELPFLRDKAHLGKTFASPARNYFIAALADFAQARSAAVEGQANGV